MMVLPLSVPHQLTLTVPPDSTRRAAQRAAARQELDGRR